MLHAHTAPQNWRPQLGDFFFNPIEKFIETNIVELDELKLFVYIHYGWKIVINWWTLGSNCQLFINPVKVYFGYGNQYFLNAHFYSIEVINALIWTSWYHCWCCRTNIELTWTFCWFLLHNYKFFVHLVAQWITLQTAVRLPRVGISGLAESVCVPTLFRYGLRGILIYQYILILEKSVIDS